MTAILFLILDEHVSLASAIDIWLDVAGGRVISRSFVHQTFRAAAGKTGGGGEITVVCHDSIPLTKCPILGLFVSESGSPEENTDSAYVLPTQLLNSSQS